MESLFFAFWLLKLAIPRLTKKHFKLYFMF